MRLIDADKLKEELKVSGLGYQYYMLDNAPTVKAIPVEWLKRWFEYQVWCGSSPTDRVHCKASDIIEDWKKENNYRDWKEENGTE